MAVLTPTEGAPDMSRTILPARNDSRRLHLFFLLAFSTLLAFPTVSRAADTPIAQEIGKTFGIDSFGQIEGMRYTWNLELPNGHTITNKWEWSPKINMVSFDGKDKAGNPVKVTYDRSKLDSQS